MNGTRWLIQAADEVNVTRQPVELGDDDRRLQLLGPAERRCKLGALVQGVGAFAGLDLDELFHDLLTFAVGELRDGLPLRLQTQAGTTLGLATGADVADDLVRHDLFRNVPTNVSMLQLMKK